MGDSVQKYYMDNSYLEIPKESEEKSKEVVNILELFRLLSTERKVEVKRLIKLENVF